MVVTLGALLGDVPHTRAGARHRHRVGSRSSSTGSSSPVRSTRARPASSACCTTRAARAACARRRCGRRCRTTWRRRRTRPRRARCSSGSASSPTWTSTSTASTSSSTSGGCRSTTRSATTTRSPSYVRELEGRVDAEDAERARHRARRAPGRRWLGARAPTTSRPRSSSSSATRTATREPDARRARLRAPHRTASAAWCTTVVRDRHRRALRDLLARASSSTTPPSRADFDHYGIPAPEVATYLVGTLELVGGALLVVGLLTRPAASLLALQHGRRDRHRRTRRRRHLPSRGGARPCSSRCCSSCGPGRGYLALDRTLVSRAPA